LRYIILYYEDKQWKIFNLGPYSEEEEDDTSIMKKVKELGNTFHVKYYPYKRMEEGN